MCYFSGVSYLLSGPLFDRLLWLCLVVAALLGAYQQAGQVWQDWQGDRTITGLKTMAKPVTELDFPAVTICKGGQNMQAVRQALQRDLARWEADSQGRRKRSAGPDDYCRSRFGQSCMAVEDMVRALGSPSAEVGSTQMGVLNYAHNCPGGGDVQGDSLIVTQCLTVFLLS